MHHITGKRPNILSEHGMTNVTMNSGGYELYLYMLGISTADMLL